MTYEELSIALQQEELAVSVTQPYAKPGENYLLSPWEVAKIFDPYVKDKDAIYNWIRVAFGESVDIYNYYVYSRTGYVPVEAGGFRCCDAYCVSGPNSDGTYDYGLLGINSIWIDPNATKTVITNPREKNADGKLTIADAFNPVASARFAIAVISARSGGSLNPWSSFKNGTYLQYYSEAATGIYLYSLIKRGREFQGPAALTMTAMDDTDGKLGLA